MRFPSPFDLPHQRFPTSGGRGFSALGRRAACLLLNCLSRGAAKSMSSQAGLQMVTCEVFVVNRVESLWPVKLHGVACQTRACPCSGAERVAPSNVNESWRDHHHHLGHVYGPRWSGAFRVGLAPGEQRERCGTGHQSLTARGTSPWPSHGEARPVG